MSSLLLCRPNIVARYKRHYRCITCSLLRGENLLPSTSSPSSSFSTSALATTTIVHCKRRRQKQLFVRHGSFTKWTPPTSIISRTETIQQQKHQREGERIRIKNNNDDTIDFSVPSPREGAEASLYHWLQQKPPTPEGVIKACNLLQQSLSNTNKENRDMYRELRRPLDDQSTIVYTNILEKLLENWLSCWREQQHNVNDALSTSSGSGRAVASPDLMLSWIDGLKDQFPTEISPSAKTYNALIEGAMAIRSGATLATTVAIPEFTESLLPRMVSAYNNHYSPPHASIRRQKQSPDILQFAFQNVMQAYVKYDKDAPSAERILERMKQMGQQNSSVRPHRNTFSIVISAYSKEGLAFQAQHVLLQSMIPYAQQQKQLCGADNKDSWLQFMPTKNDFESCLNAWSRSSHVHAGKHAEMLLMKMQELRMDHSLEFQPCIKSILKIIKAWSTSRQKEEAAIRCQAILHQLIQELEINWESAEDIKSIRECYIETAKACSFSNAKDAPERIEALLNEMERIVGSESIPWPDWKRLYLYLLSAWALSGRKNRACNVMTIFDDLKNKCAQAESQLDLHSYNSLLKALGKAGDGKGALGVLVEMQSGSTKIKPSLSSYNSVLLAISKSNDPCMARNAEALYLEMSKAAKHDQTIRPNALSCNLLLAALSSDSGRTLSNGNINVDVANRGEAYLQELKERYAHSGGDHFFKPDRVTYNKLVLLWATVSHKTPDAPKRAEALVDEMNDLVRAGDRSMLPDHSTFKALMTVMLNSNHPNKNEKVRRIQLEINKLSYATN